MSESTTPVFKAGVQSEADPYEFVLSDETRDRQGDIIRVKAWEDLSQFKANPVALFGHSHKDILGIWTHVRVEGTKLLGRLKLAEPGTSELIDTVRKLIDQRILKAVSVGFMPQEGQPIDKGDPYAGYEYTKAALHEVSVVAVPANSAALAVAKAFSPDVADRVFVRPDSEELDAIFREPPGRVADKLETPNLKAAREMAAKLNIKESTHGF